MSIPENQTAPVQHHQNSNFEGENLNDFYAETDTNQKINESKFNNTSQTTVNKDTDKSIFIINEEKLPFSANNSDAKPLKESKITVGDGAVTAILKYFRSFLADIFKLTKSWLGIAYNKDEWFNKSDFKLSFNIIEINKISAHDFNAGNKNTASTDSTGNTTSQAINAIIQSIPEKDHAEFKNCLLQLYSSENSTKSKNKALDDIFNITDNKASIKNASDGDKKKFALTITLDSGKTFHFNLAKKDFFIEQLSPSFNDEAIHKDLLTQKLDEHQWSMDLPRDGIKVDGIYVKSEEEFNSIMKEKNYSENQIILIKTYCVQTTLGALGSCAVDDVKMNFVAGNNPTRIINVSKNKNEELHITIQTKFDITQDDSYDELIERMEASAAMQIPVSSGYKDDSDDEFFEIKEDNDDSDDEFFEMMEESAAVQTPDIFGENDARPVMQVIECDLMLDLVLPENSKNSEFKLTGHVGFYAAPENS